MEYIIDLSAITTAQELHRLLARELPLPEWYGHNLDALYDCLTELEAPVRLIVRHWDPSAPFAAGFESVFADAQAENSDFSYAFA